MDTVFDFNHERGAVLTVLYNAMLRRRDLSLVEIVLEAVPGRDITQVPLRELEAGLRAWLKVAPATAGLRNDKAANDLVGELCQRWSPDETTLGSFLAGIAQIVSYELPLLPDEAIYVVLVQMRELEDAELLEAVKDLSSRGVVIDAR